MNLDKNKELNIIMTLILEIKEQRKTYYEKTKVDKTWKVLI